MAEKQPRSMNDKQAPEKSFFADMWSQYGGLMAIIFGVCSFSLIVLLVAAIVLVDHG